MRRHSKASAVRSTLDAGSNSARSGRVVATRVAPGDVKGSGAPSFGRLTGLAIAIAAVALLVLTPLAPAKTVIGGFGTDGTEGGQFETPRGIAVNNSGNGGVAAGTTYVVDSQFRVQRFSPAGAFERTWGFDVDSAAGTGFEICTVAANCQAGVEEPTTENGGQLSNPQGIAVNQASGHVYVTETGNRRVSEFDAAGNFVRAWGFDVDSAAGTGFEICTVAASCQQGTGGSSGGQFGFSLGYPAIDASGNVWVPDQTNNRIQGFSSTGAFLKVVGGDVIADGATGTGTLTASSNSVSSVTTTSRVFEVGQVVTSPDHPGEILPGTTITECSPDCFNATELTLSQNTAVSVTAGPQAISVAAGAGNVASNEVQTIAVQGGTKGGGFNLEFNGQSTKVTGTAVFNNSQFNITNVTTAIGTFEVGQGITGLGIPAGTTIVAFDNAKHIITLSSAATSGVNATRPITAYAIQRDSSAASLQARLEGLSSIGAGNVAVSGPNGGPWAVEFKGTRFAGADLPPLEVTAALSPSGSVSISSANPNSLEVCTVAAVCRAGAAGTALGQFSGSSPGDLAFDSAGNLYALDEGNARVQKFNPALSSVANFGASAFAPFNATAAPERMTAAQAGSRLDFSIQKAGTSERNVLELDTSGNLKDSSLDGAKLVGNSAITGLASEDASGTIYAATGQGSRSVLALGSTPLPAPIPVLGPVSGKTETSALFSGTIDPNGGIGVTCSYEYSTDQVSWTKVDEPGCSSLVAGGGAQAISETVNGLAPNTHYFLRLAVTRVLDPGSIQRTAVLAFDTTSAAPIVSNPAAIDISDTSARLVGRIDPRNSATGYVFQYGTTPALGSSTAPVNVGGGTNPVVVSQLIQGLSPNTTYYFKLVATNAFGSAATTGQSFVTRSEPLPSPENRSFEMVSPPDKNATNIDAGTHAKVTIAPDGETISFCSGASFGETPVNMSSPFCGDYVDRRTADGWRTVGIRPYFCPANDNAPAAELNAQTKLRMSPALDQAAFQLPEAESCLGSLVPGAPMPETNLYREDLLSSPFSYDLLTPAFNFAPKYAENQLGNSFEGGSDDWSHLVYTSTGKQTIDAATPASGVNQLYDWHGGTIALVSKNTAGNAFTTPSVLAQNDGIGSISASGSRIFFQNPAPNRTCAAANCELYLREASATTWVSQQECTSACSNTQASDVFEWGSDDGSKAFFMSSAKLTDDAQGNANTCNSEASGSSGCNLYLYIQGPNPGSEKNLTLVSKDNEPADGSSPDVTGVLGASGNGDTVYFVAKGQLAPGAPLNSFYKIYRWRWSGGSPAIDYLATLTGIQESSPFDPNAKNWLYGNADPHESSHGAPAIRQVTSDGSRLLLRTTATLLPAIDTDTDLDIYLWSEAGWKCISCQQPGVASNGESNVEPMKVGTQGSQLATQSREMRTVMTDDARKVFFTSRDPLVSQDTNGIGDVYEWHDGRLSLISSGVGTGPSTLIEISESGDDVFFSSTQRLVGWDNDTSTDYYDARVGGGFPEPPATGAPCEGESCRGPSSTPLVNTGAGTAAFQGPGNPAPAKPKKKKSKKHNSGKKKQQRHGQRAAGSDRRAGK